MGLENLEEKVRHLEQDVDVPGKVLTGIAHFSMGVFVGATARMYDQTNGTHYRELTMIGSTALLGGLLAAIKYLPRIENKKTAYANNIVNYLELMAGMGLSYTG